MISYERPLLDKISKNLAYPDDPLGAPLLSIYATPILNLLVEKVGKSSLGSLIPNLNGNPIIDETTAQKQFLIERSVKRPTSKSDLILSAPHFYVGTPLAKQPNEGCRS
jgi:hypothetical protein